MDYKLYLENKEKFFTRLKRRCIMIRSLNDDECFKDEIKEVRKFEEFKNVNLPELDNFIIYYTEKVKFAKKGYDTNPSSKKSKEVKERNQLINLINEYKGSSFEEEEVSLLSTIRNQQRSLNAVEKITLYRKGKIANISISSPKIIIGIFYSLIESELFVEKSIEFTNTKSKDSYYAELYRSLPPFYLYLKNHITYKYYRDIYRLLGKFLNRIGLPFEPPVETLENYLKSLNRKLKSV